MKKSKKNKVNYNFPKETCELIQNGMVMSACSVKCSTTWTSADQKCF